MATEILVKQGAQFLFADHAADFGAAPATAANSMIIGTPTDVQIDMSSVAASGGARQAAKANLTTPWASEWVLDACIEFAVAPTDGGTVDFYWASSPSSTAATGNPGGTTGSDAAFTDTTGNLGEMIHIGSLTVRNNVIAIGNVGILRPTHQYGNLVVVNNADQALPASVDECHVTLTELIDESQDA